MRKITVLLTLSLALAGITQWQYSYTYHSDKFGGVNIPMTPVYVAGGLAAPAALQFSIGKVWRDSSLQSRFLKVSIAHIGAAALMYYIPGRVRWIPRTLNSDPGDPAGTNFVMVTLSVSLPIQSLWMCWRAEKKK